MYKCKPVENEVSNSLCYCFEVFPLEFIRIHTPFNRYLFCLMFAI